MVCGGLSFYPYARPGAGNPPRSLASPVPGTVEAMVEVPSATTNADSPELMAEVMVTIPARVQVGMSKAVMEGAFPRSVAIAVIAATGSAEVVGPGPIGVSPGTTSSAGPGGWGKVLGDGARCWGMGRKYRSRRNREPAGALARPQLPRSNPGGIERCRSPEGVPAG